MKMTKQLYKTFKVAKKVFLLYIVLQTRFFLTAKSMALLKFSVDILAPLIEVKGG